MMRTTIKRPASMVYRLQSAGHHSAIEAAGSSGRVLHRNVPASARDGAAQRGPGWIAQIVLVLNLVSGIGLSWEGDIYHAARNADIEVKAGRNQHEEVEVPSAMVLVHAER